MNMATKITLSFFGGAAVGAGASWYLTKRHLEKKMEETIREEVDAVKEHYKLIRKEDYKSPEDFIQEKYREQLDELGYSQDDDRTPQQDDESLVGNRSSILKAYSEDPEFVPEEAVVNLFDRGVSAREVIETLKESPDGVSHNDYKALKMQDLIDQRDDNSDEAYVITIDEFQEEAKEYDKITLTYYEGDDTLVDERQNPVPEVEQLLGTEALVNFGIGSKDEMIVYVRNDRIESDFEVIKDEREYAESVLGFREKKVNPKFQEDD